jgi:hypothetical protein
MKSLANLSLENAEVTTSLKELVTNREAPDDAPEPAAALVQPIEIIKAAPIGRVFNEAASDERERDHLHDGTLHPPCSGSHMSIGGFADPQMTYPAGSILCTCGSSAVTITAFVRLVSGDDEAPELTESQIVISDVFSPEKSRFQVPGAVVGMTTQMSRFRTHMFTSTGYHQRFAPQLFIYFLTPTALRVMIVRLRWSPVAEYFKTRPTVVFRTPAIAHQQTKVIETYPAFSVRPICGINVYGLKYHDVYRWEIVGADWVVKLARVEWTSEEMIGEFNTPDKFHHMYTPVIKEVFLSSVTTSTLSGGQAPLQSVLIPSPRVFHTVPNWDMMFTSTEPGRYLNIMEHTESGTLERPYTDITGDVGLSLWHHGELDDDCDITPGYKCFIVRMGPSGNARNMSGTFLAPTDSYTTAGSSGHLPWQAWPRTEAMSAAPTVGLPAICSGLTSVPRTCETWATTNILGGVAVYFTRITA